MNAVPPIPWSRPEAARTGPLRGIGGYYRSADREVDGKVFRGAPLNQAEDVAVAAVRMAYKIADAQIDRGLRVARDLRGAAQSRGVDPQDALDASERLLRKALLAGLQWIESAAGDDENPLRRLAKAEYRMLGSLFGLARKRDEGDAAEPAAAPAPPASHAPTQASARDERDARPPLQIYNDHEPPGARRPVQGQRLALPSERHKGSYPDLQFHPEDAISDVDVIAAKLSWDDSGVGKLVIPTQLTHQRGTWVAGIYEPDGQQVGVLCIVL